MGRHHRQEYKNQASHYNNLTVFLSGADRVFRTVAGTVIKYAATDTLVISTDVALNGVWNRCR